MRDDAVLLVTIYLESIVNAVSSGTGFDLIRRILKMDSFFQLYLSKRQDRAVVSK